MQFNESDTYSPSCMQRDFESEARCLRVCGNIDLQNCLSVAHYSFFQFFSRSIRFLAQTIQT